MCDGHEGVTGPNPWEGGGQRFSDWGAPARYGPLRLATTHYGSSPVRWVNAARFRTDSPRDTRHAYSLRIADAKPSSSRVLKEPSAFSTTEPSSRSISSADTAASGSRPLR